DRTRPQEGFGFVALDHTILGQPQAAPTERLRLSPTGRKPAAQLLADADPALRLGHHRALLVAVASDCRQEPSHATSALPGRPWPPVRRSSSSHGESPSPSAGSGDAGSGATPPLTSAASRERATLARS